MKPLVEFEAIAVPYTYPVQIPVKGGGKFRYAPHPAAEPFVVNLLKATPEQAPCAFIVHEPAWYQDDAGKTIPEEVVTKVIRLGDKHWVPAFSHKTYPNPLTRQELEAELIKVGRTSPWDKPSLDGMLSGSLRAVTPEASRAAVQRKLAEFVADFIEVDGCLYTNINEPLYAISTQGRGNNQGGTSVVVAWGPDYIHQDDWRDKTQTFQADQKPEAIAAAEAIARARGDTQSIPIIPQGYIDVLLEIPGRAAQQRKELRKIFRAKVDAEVEADADVLLLKQKIAASEAELSQLRAQKRQERQSLESSFLFVASNQDL